ncbi:MAG: translation termination factor GTPase eRF3 [Phylliscum demangeonii]|nr:MAG: translation termination factor GTPase eRF3 [Phylliscum demangeonii]
MADLNSWEDDPAAQDENNLARRTQQNLNIQDLSQTQPGGFRPSAAAFQPGAFQPGAQTFQPGQQFHQYGALNQSQYPASNYAGGQPQYNQYNQGGYGYPNQGYGSQLGQGGYGPGYNQPYGSYALQQQQQQQQQPPPPQQQQRSYPAPNHAPRQYPNAPVIAQQPSAGEPAAPPAFRSAGPIGGSAMQQSPVTSKKDDALTEATVPRVPSTIGAKVLSIGGEAPKAKVLSIGSTSGSLDSARDQEKKDTPIEENGAKARASKAIEKTEKNIDGASPSVPDSGSSSPTRGDAKAAQREIDAVAKEQVADVDYETLEEVYGKEHVNLIFIGHVDAGKSTLGGSILYATGMVDERTMEKYKREAKDLGRETWYLSWALDLTKEERAKGKTVEVGRGFFETEKRRYTILDAPGHKTFVPNMIGGASQADVGILVISARKGEYETGFEKGGQTREHAMLAKTQGVNKLVVVVNKMDDPTVEWSKDRYDECTTKLKLFLKATGYDPKNDLTFMPISAQTSVGIMKRVPKDLAPWYDGPSLLEHLDNMKALERKVKAPFMMPVNGKYRDMGTLVEGKIESGVIKKGSTLVMMPNREKTEVATLYGETEDEINGATCGDQVRIRLRGIEEEDILPGFVLCAPKRLVHCVSAFEAQIRILELKNILSAGFNCVLHVHAAIEEVTFAALLHKLEKNTGRKSKKPPAFAAKGQSIIARLEVIGGAGAVCVERFEDYPQLGRFTLRDQGQTIAIGKITKLLMDTPATT